MNYPEEWNQLPRHERRKKIKFLRKQQEKKEKTIIKIRNIALMIVLIFLIFLGYFLFTRKTPEEVEFEKQIEAVSLDQKVEEFAIEGRSHVSASAQVEYKTNPPTSGSHLAQAINWGIYNQEIDDKAALHSLEHGGIWISYKDLTDGEIQQLQKIAQRNSQSVVLNPRAANDNRIVVASWGRMMKLENVDEALIQKYIDTFKNQSPEKLAR